MNQNEIEAELKQWKEMIESMDSATDKFHYLVGANPDSDFFTMIESMDNATDKFHGLVGTDPDSEFFTPIYKMMELYTKAVAKIVGDEFGWLDWYWLECDMGRKGCNEAKLATEKEFRTVKSIKDLAKLIYDGSNE